MIRAAGIDDLTQVCEIDCDAFSPYGTAESPSIIAARLTAFAEGFVVAESRQTIIGYGSSEKWLDDRQPALNEDPSSTHHPSGQVFCVTAMAVRRAYQGLCCGTAILDHLITIARQHHCQSVTLETTHAQEFYLHRGFNEVGKRQHEGISLSIMKYAIEHH